jgi:hypothetical protein
MLTLFMYRVCRNLSSVPIPIWIWLKGPAILKREYCAGRGNRYSVFGN